MKHFLITGILIAICMYTQAQTVSFPMKAGKVHYEIVDSSLQGKTKAQLYSMSKLWLFDQFEDVDDQLQLDIPEGGLIAGRMAIPGAIYFTGRGDYTCSFSFMVVSKDGRFKARLYDFRLTSAQTGMTYGMEAILQQPDKYKDQKNAYLKLEGQAYGFIRSIQHAMESVYDVMDF